MRSFVILLSAVFICTTMTMAEEQEGGFKPGSEPDGFKGIKWGAPRSSIQGLKFVNSIFSVDYYEREGDKLSIGRAKIKSISYLFWEDKLTGVVIDISGLSNYKFVMSTLIEKYGNPVVGSGEIAGTSIWFGQVTIITSMYMKERNLCELAFDSKESQKLSKKRRKEEKEREKQEYKKAIKKAAETAF